MTSYFLYCIDHVTVRQIVLLLYSNNKESVITVNNFMTILIKGSSVYVTLFIYRPAIPYKEMRYKRQSCERLSGEILRSVTPID